MKYILLTMGLAACAPKRVQQPMQPTLAAGSEGAASEGDIVAQVPPQQPQQPPPQQPAPYPQPQPQQYPPQQPYPYPQPYPPPAPYPQPYPPPQYSYPAPYPAPQQSWARLHDGEVIGDFAAVGALASIDLMIRQDINDGGVGTLILLAGLGGGAGTGWLLADRYHIDAGAAHSTTIGLMVGAANGALLIEPTKGAGKVDSGDAMGLIFIGSAVGAAGGFAYGQAADLTSGQSTFLLNAVLLSTGTAMLGAIAGSRDGHFGNFESGTIAIGLDAGLVGGAIIAPKLEWSGKRSKQVLAATALGALIGGALPGLFTKRNTTNADGTTNDEYNGDLVAGCMTAGLWGGFGLGILLTKDEPVDVKYMKPVKAPPAPISTLSPWAGPHGTVGMMASGSW